ncbi:unannotated protein [freshwater metagenome]|uniref:Unannotated protein n=1 Tax=freshwater metagenome TaxID=449393 RepID=A0A6J7XUD0_9ZZZZ
MLEITKPPRTLRQRIGGKWSTSWQTFLINSILSLLVLAEVEKVPSKSTSELFSWIYAWAISLLFLGVLVFAISRTILRNREKSPVPIWVALSINATIGIFYSFSTEMAIHFFGITSVVPFSIRLLANTLLVTWWGSMLTIFLDFREEESSAKKYLVESAVQLSLQEMQRNEISALVRADIHREIEDNLKHAQGSLKNEMDSLSKLDSSSASITAQQTQRISELLFNVAKDSVKPLSKSLWAREGEIYPRHTWREVLVRVTQFQPFYPGLLAAIDIIGAAPQQINDFGVNRGLPLVIAATLLILTIGTIFNLLMKEWPRHHAKLFFVGIVVLQSSIVPMRVHFRELWEPGSATITWQLTQHITGIVIIFMTSSVGAFRKMNTESREIFSSEIKEELVSSIARSRELANLARESSRILHGAVQTRLVSCAIAIERAYKQESARDLTLALQEALDVLSSPLRESAFADSITGEVERKISLWKGLCDFDLSIDIGDIPNHPHTTSVVGRIIEEAISNSIRHGDASKIQIAIEVREKNRLIIVVEDNGSGIKKGNPGIGSALLQQESGGNWSLQPQESGTRLEVQIPLVGELTQ